VVIGYSGWQQQRSKSLTVQEDNGREETTTSGRHKSWSNAPRQRRSRMTLKPVSPRTGNVTGKRGGKREPTDASSQCCHYGRFETYGRCGGGSDDRGCLRSSSPRDSGDRSFIIIISPTFVFIRYLCVRPYAQFRPFPSRSHHPIVVSSLLDHGHVRQQKSFDNTTAAVLSSVFYKVLSLETRILGTEDHACMTQKRRWRRHRKEARDCTVGSIKYYRIKRTARVRSVRAPLLGIREL
jgi:hypothetical protein